MSQAESREVMEEFWRNYYLRGQMLFDPTGAVAKGLYHQPYTGIPFGRGFIIDQQQRIAAATFGHNPDLVINTIRGLLGPSCPPGEPCDLPGIMLTESVNTHDAIGPVGVPIDLDASLGIDSGEVTTEPRIDGVNRLEITFAAALDASVGALGMAAIAIVPDPGVGVSTSLTNSDRTLVIELAPALPDERTYRIGLTDLVRSAEPSAAGDRIFELRALAGSVQSEAGSGPQVVNALDLGLTGIRGRFGAEVADPANAPFDINQDGTINAPDVSCLRLSCGLFGNAAP